MHQIERESKGAEMLREINRLRDELASAQLRLNMATLRYQEHIGHVDPELRARLFLKSSP